MSSRLSSPNANSSGGTQSEMRWLRMKKTLPELKQTFRPLIRTSAAENPKQTLMMRYPFRLCAHIDAMAVAEHP